MLMSKGLLTLTSPRMRRSSDGRVVRVAAKREEVGFGFSAGGLLFPYFIGVASTLERKGLLTRNTKMAGSSAGALISAFFLSGLSSDILMEGCLRVADDCRTNGTRGRLRSVLNEIIRDILPEDAHLKCSGKAFVGITQLYPFGNVLVSEFETREDLICALLASCHVPVWFDSRLLTEYKERWVLDGGLTNLIPAPPVTRPIRISCFPMQGWGEDFNAKIAPDRYGPSKYTIQQLVSMALEPASEKGLYELYELGEQDAEAYVESDTMPSLDEETGLDILFDPDEMPASTGTNLWNRMRSVFISRNPMSESGQPTRR